MARRFCSVAEHGIGTPCRVVFCLSLFGAGSALRWLLALPATPTAFFPIFGIDFFCRNNMLIGIGLLAERMRPEQCR